MFREQMSCRHWKLVSKAFFFLKATEKSWKKIPIKLWANYNDVSRGHLEKWWFNKGTSPKSPKNSGLGIILICPENWMVKLQTFFECSSPVPRGNGSNLTVAYFWDWVEKNHQLENFGYILRETQHTPGGIPQTSPCTPKCCRNSET